MFKFSRVKYFIVDDRYKLLIDPQNHIFCKPRMLNGVCIHIMTMVGNMLIDHLPTCSKH